LPFIYDTFYQKEPKLAFSLLMQRYNISMKEAQRLIDIKRLYCDNKVVELKNQPISGEIKLLLFKPLSKGLKPLFKTKDFLLFDKPSGLIIHPKKIQTPYSLLDEIRIYGTKDSNAAHRIDKETSGLVIASMNKQSEIELKKMFEAKQIQKSYLAWVRGNTKDYFEVEEPIKIRKDYSTSKHKVKICKSGKYAKTIFKKLSYNKALDASLVKAIPITGRTHQIRIHLYSISHPILGDPLYGTTFEFATKYLDNNLSLEDRIKYSGAKRLMLHALSLEFRLNGIRYILKSKMDFNLEAEV